jgi:hypothetical protein
MTIYHGSRLPPLYVGSTTSKRLSNGYHGSVRSQQFGSTWKQELQDHPELFETHEIDTYPTRQEALGAEEALQRLFNAVKSDVFINMAYARGGFINPGKWSDEVKAKMSISAKLRGQPKPHHRAPRILLGPEGMKANAARKRKEKAALIKAAKPPKPVKVKLTRQEINQRISIALIGHSVSEETKQKIAIKAKVAHTGRKQSPEQVAKRVASRKATLAIRQQVA